MIYIGPEHLARRAKALIQAWRDAALTPDDHRRKQLLGSCNLVAEAGRYSGRARKRLQDAATKAAGDPIEALKLAVSLRGDVPETRRGRQPGRPARSGLW